MRLFVWVVQLTIRTTKDSSVDKDKKEDFMKYYEPIHDQLYRFCRAIAGNVQDAEDLMQDTILNVLDGFHRIDNLSAFKAFAFSVASNLQKMKHRRSKFSTNFNEEEINQIVDSGQNLEYYADFNIVYEKLLSLPSRTSETLILYHISDLSVEDIRDIQGGSISAVKSRLQRGRAKVLSLLNAKAHLKTALLFFAC